MTPTSSVFQLTLPTITSPIDLSMNNDDDEKKQTSYNDNESDKMMVTMQANTTQQIADHYSNSSDNDDDGANVYDLSSNNLQKILDTLPNSETTKKRGKPSLVVTMTIDELIADRRKKQNEVSRLKKRCREQQKEIKELKDKRDEDLIENDKSATEHELRVSEKISIALIKLASK